MNKWMNGLTEGGRNRGMEEGRGGWIEDGRVRGMERKGGIEKQKGGIEGERNGCMEGCLKELRDQWW